MRPFKSLLPLGEAVAIAMEAASPIKRVETVQLPEAVGRVLAADVVAPIDVPMFDKAAMDGYALRSADTQDREGETVLRLIGRSHAGEPFEGTVGPGECVEVATGSSVPTGSDSVVEVEATRVEEYQVTLSGKVAAGRNVSPRGEDILQGGLLVSEGTQLKPGHLGAISSLGILEVSVFSRPKVAVYATGREVRRGGPLGPGEVYDANTFTLAGLVQENGGSVRISDPVPDILDEMLGAVGRAKEYDVVILSGSTSVGERDYLRDATESLGEVMFHGVAAKPGKPLLLARVGKGLVFGMPGFPASCILLAYHVLRPVLRKMARLPLEPARVHLPLGEDMPLKDGLTQLVTVHMEDGKAYKAFKKSGSITSVSEGEGYVVIQAGERLSQGDSVDVVLF